MLSLIAFVVGGHFFTLPFGRDSGSFWELAWDLVQHAGDFSWRFIISIFYVWAAALLLFSVAFGWIAQAIVRIFWTALGRLIGPRGHRID